MSMRTLDYYFGKKGDDAGVAGPSRGPESPHRQPTFNMVIGKRKCGKLGDFEKLTSSHDLLESPTHFFKLKCSQNCSWPS